MKSLIAIGFGLLASVYAAGISPKCQKHIYQVPMCPRYCLEDAILDLGCQAKDYSCVCSRPKDVIRIAALCVQHCGQMEILLTQRGVEDMCTCLNPKWVGRSKIWGDNYAGFEGFKKGFMHKDSSCDNRNDRDHSAPPVRMQMKPEFLTQLHYTSAQPASNTLNEKIEDPHALRGTIVMQKVPRPRPTENQATNVDEKLQAADVEEPRVHIPIEEPEIRPVELPRYGEITKTSMVHKALPTAFVRFN